MLAINGDYDGFRDTGVVVRNGVVYRDEGTRERLAFSRDGHVEVYDETATSADALVAAGVWNTLSFGPALLEDGQVVDGIEDVEVDTDVGNPSIRGDQPPLVGYRVQRTAVLRADRQPAGSATRASTTSGVR